jgi:hypothetical protein
MCVHGVKHILSRGESKAKDVSGAYWHRQIFDHGGTARIQLQ